MKRPKILIVDDNERDAQLMREYLSDHGYDIVVTQEGADALNQMQIHNPDLVIMDIIMSKMSGWKACEEIKKDERYRHIPVLMCSASIQDDEEFHRYGTGDGYIQKPVRPDQFLSVVKEFLNKS